MSSSRTHNLMVFLNGTFWSISVALEQSVSLRERTTLMGVLISMLSAISDENSGPDDPISLMLEAATRTLRHQEVVQSSVGTMQSKMETLLQGGWHGRAQVDFLRLRINGARLSEQKTSSSFGSLLKSWIQKHSQLSTHHSESLLTGDSGLSPSPTFIPMGSNLSLEWYLSWLNGENSLLDMIQEVSHASPSRPCGA
ncbi:putative ORF3 protein [Giant panda associated gemycircularvirus]|uniref:Putative ORF3 protein n=1 Tax=Giant panda associated gemycircularvirus TaxID=2016461 RepID=A0A220IGP5_9VIRU|nr:putative ORF3 protein [Giant panda associated gemycircularvirus]ASH99147.1 putative ORF3 protein [Giant panda associated gemycircularvirus]ASH99150.1 putative ORF3 protein [Giant panda associated gemycircularvirus]